jgi:hypothetical protein
VSPLPPSRTPPRGAADVLGPPGALHANNSVRARVLNAETVRDIRCGEPLVDEGAVIEALARVSEETHPHSHRPQPEARRFEAQPAGADAKHVGEVCRETARQLHRDVQERV